MLRNAKFDAIRRPRARGQDAAPGTGSTLRDHEGRLGETPGRSFGLLSVGLAIREGASLCARAKLASLRTLSARVQTARSYRSPPLVYLNRNRLAADSDKSPPRGDARRNRIGSNTFRLRIQASPRTADLWRGAELNHLDRPSPSSARTAAGHRMSASSDCQFKVEPPPWTRSRTPRRRSRDQAGIGGNKTTRRRS